MKSANLSFFAVIGVACALALSGTVACGVSGDGLGNATDPDSSNVGSGSENGSGMNAGNGNATGQGGESQPAAGGNSASGGSTASGGNTASGGSAMMGSKGGSQANTGGSAPAGGGGMRMGGAGGMNTGGSIGTGGAVGTGGAAGLGGMNTGGAAGLGGMNMGGALGPVYNKQPTPGDVNCGDVDCNDGDHCCVTNGQSRCQSRSKACQGGAYRNCDDKSDCAPTSVCCGSMSQNSFNTICVLASQCAPPEVSLCANSTQCGDNRACCEKTFSSMTIGVCQRSCQ